MVIEYLDSPIIEPGLEGVYFTRSHICKVDGTNGRLYYRGYAINLLAGNSTFEEVCYLLLNGQLPDSSELLDFEKQLRAERELPEQIIAMVSEMAAKADPMDVARSAISSLPAYDKEAYESSSEANMRKSIRLISKLASIVAAIARFRSGSEYVRPKASLGHAENFLYMMNGEEPEARKAKLLDTMLILHAEHSSNASTFSTLVTGSTLADLYAAVTSGMGTLKGPLHGGADEAALKMMRAIGKPENTEKYIEEALAGKQRIMGFGHRVYKTYDPRARIIREDLIAMQEDESEEVRNLTAIALRAERMMIERLGQSKGIWPNVDFFSGPVYTYIGIPIELFTPLFAVSRMPGWCAHMMEYWQNNRLLRPLEEYVGPLDLNYIPMNERK
jgi:citrate synthase